MLGQGMYKNKIPGKCMHMNMCVPEIEKWDLDMSVIFKAIILRHCETWDLDTFPKSKISKMS